ncbi:uncharacterized protein LOC141854963 [Brevipalpus obovatus]|uniref:uncharacterized protein LOC141854963 n=1 Tax=Brevipalpus obovatus TaxID=246614 RepID=UPI003D9E30BF
MSQGKVVQGVDITSVSDEEQLQNMLDKTEDFNERKIIREKIRELHEQQKERLVSKLENFREDNIKKKLQDAASDKQKEMQKLQEISDKSKIGQRMHNFTPGFDVGPANDSKGIKSDAPTLDYMQESLRERVSSADQRKKGVLDQYDALSKQAKDKQPPKVPNVSISHEETGKTMPKQLSIEQRTSSIDKQSSASSASKKAEQNKTPANPEPKTQKHLLQPPQPKGKLAGVNLAAEDDMDRLNALLDSVEDFEERKRIRDRIRELREVEKAKREELCNRLESFREENIKKKVMSMAAETQKKMSKLEEVAKKQQTGQRMQNYTPMVDVGPANDPDRITNSAPTLDFMQDCLKERVNTAAQRKNKVLDQYDALAKQPREQRDSKANAFNKFKQMDAANVKANPTAAAPVKPNVARGASDVKEMLLRWCRSKTQGYSNVEITNFSSSWSDGLAFCALIHHYFPDSFDFNKLDPKNRRKNFELGFKTAEEKADIFPLLEVDDMVLMKDKPDWKCVFTHVQSMYRKLREFD